ncbi:uncharacterized protein LOC144243719 [Crocuta crocuta]
MVLPSRPRRWCLSPAIPRHPQLTAMLALSSAAVPRHRLRLPGALRALGLSWKQMGTLRWTALGTVRQAARPFFLQDPDRDAPAVPRGLGVAPDCCSVIVRGDLREKEDREAPVPLLCLEPLMKAAVSWRGKLWCRDGQTAAC